MTPTRREALRGVALAAIASTVAGCSSSTRTSTGTDPTSSLGLAGTVLADPLEKPSGGLVDTAGRPYDFAAETSGSLAVLFFGYTSCPDVCPVNLATLARALADLGGELERTTVAFVGTDTERDTPEAIRAYLDTFDRRFVGLTGTAEDIRGVMAALNLPPVVVDAPDADGNYDVGHSSQMLVFTPDDRCHVVYPFGTRVQDWVADLPRLSTIDWTEAGR